MGLVIDEPTNYLDRDALGALTEAIEKYGGGVVVISHNMDFCNRVATEKWIMDAGYLTAEGGNYCDEKIEEDNEEKEIFDAWQQDRRQAQQDLDGQGEEEADQGH